MTAGHETFSTVTADIVERLRKPRGGALTGEWPGPTALDLEAAAEIERLRITAQRQLVSPRLTDNDAGEITVTIDGKELRGWSYKDDAERRIKMLAAREYVEGWGDGRDAA